MFSALLKFRKFPRALERDHFFKSVHVKFLVVTLVRVHDAQVVSVPLWLMYSSDSSDFSIGCVFISYVHIAHNLCGKDPRCPCEDEALYSA